MWLEKLKLHCFSKSAKNLQDFYSHIMINYMITFTKQAGKRYFYVEFSSNVYENS